MPLYLHTEADLEAEIGAERVRQVYDDDNSGASDVSPVDHARAKSAAYVIGGLHRVYPTLPALAATWQADLSLVPERLRQLSLDYNVALAAKRNPAYVQRNWSALIRHVDEQIARIRKEGLDGLGIDAAPEPATNQGGDVWAGGDNLADENTLVFNGPGTMGDW